LAFLVAACFLVGLGEAGTLPSATRVITTWVPKTRRGFAQGATHAAARAAAAITPLLMVALIDWRGWRAAFFVVGGVSLLWVACWFLYFRNNPRRHSGVTAAELAGLPPFQENIQSVSAVPWSRLIRRMMPVTIVFFCHAWTLWLYLTWLPSFFHDTYHMDIKHSAIFTSVAFLGGMIGDVMGGLLTDGIFRRTGNLTQARRNVVICAFLGSLLCLMVMMIWRNQIIVALSLSASLFFLEMAEAPVWSVPSDVAARYAGIAGGILSTAAGVAAIVSPLAFGIISQVTGSDVLPFLLSNQSVAAKPAAPRYPLLPLRHPRMRYYRIVDKIQRRFLTSRCVCFLRLGCIERRRRFSMSCDTNKLNPDLVG
jgi:MFS family permease